jgi:hypothetical protein
MNWFKRWIEKIKAEGRGEVRLDLPPETRGRTYVKTILKPSIYARVYRASEGKWYDLGKLS